MASQAFEFDFSDLTRALPALFQRYGEFMDLGLESARAEMPRRKRAFDVWESGKELEQDIAGEREARAAQEATWARQRELAAGKRYRSEKGAAQMRERGQRQAQHERGLRTAMRHDPMGAFYHTATDFGTTVSPWSREYRGARGA